jgi:nicotinamide-nucleotide amidase
MRHFVYTPELEEQAAELLKAVAGKKLAVATAESCTGGALAALLTDVEGISHQFERGYVVYSDEAKHECLGVPRDLIAEHGAVSRPVAEAMARGALERSRAGLSIAITGFAGPAGPGEEAGLVHLAVALRGGPVVRREHRFGELDRASVRIRSLGSALDMASGVLDAYKRGAAT